MTCITQNPECAQIPAARETKRKQQDCCFTRRHLSPAAVAYHHYALSVSRQSGIFYRDDRRDADEFGVGKSTVCRWAQECELKGFFMRIESRKRWVRGRFASLKYRVLSHDEWVKLHPGQCRVTCPTGGTGDYDCTADAAAPRYPVPPVNQPVPGSALANPTGEFTSPIGGTKNRKERIEERVEKQRRENLRGVEEIWQDFCDQLDHRKPCAAASAARAPFLPLLPLKDGNLYDVTEEMAVRWWRMYPGINVDKELFNMRDYLHDNPKKRKTAEGMEEFVYSWLAQAQHRADLDACISDQDIPF